MRLFWIGDTEIRCDPLFLPLAAFAWISGNIAALVMSLAAVLLHETAHAVMSTLLGYRVASVKMQPYGCTAVIEGLSSWFDELMIAFAGPLLSLFTYICCKAYGAHAAADFGTVNLYIAAINLLPVYPLDGGRALCALLSIISIKPPRWLIASASLLAGCIVGALAFAANNVTLIIFSAFMLSSAISHCLRNDAAAVAQLRRVQTIATGRTLEVRHMAVSADSSLSCLLSYASGGNHIIFCVLDEDMCTIAHVDYARALELAALHGADKKIGEALASIDRLTQ